MQTLKIFIPDPKKLERKCYIIDAKDKILGRVAVKAADILRGKHKPTFTPHLDTGDTVVVINAAKIRVTGNKMEGKVYQRYTGYPSGQKTLTLEKLLVKAPTQPMRSAINRMIPAGRLGNQIRTRVRIYADENHPHASQNPIPVEVEK